MERNLIVGADGSEESLRAVDWAVDEAVRRGVALRIVHASAWERYEGHRPSFGTHRGAARTYADHVIGQAVERARIRAPGLGVTGEVLADDPAIALVRESTGVGAVVVGHRGRGELLGLLLGSVSLSVAAHAPSPVIVVRGGEQQRAGAFHQVVLGVDERDDAAPAVALAVRAAEERGAVLSAVHAWRCPSHEVPEQPRAADSTDTHQLRAQWRLDEVLQDVERDHRAVSVRHEALEGHARTALLNASATADLLVVGARRRAGHLGMQLGPVNHAVLHHSACPVAVVPHP